MSAKRPRTRQDLEDLLSEQFAFLEASAESFDKGFEGEAKRLALAIRILLHDTSTSQSLLGQLSRKSGPHWDSSLSSVPGNRLPEAGLVYIAMGGKEPKYVAMLDNVPMMRQVPFDAWWNSTIFVDDRGETRSRRDIILTAANQDGGAHIDPSLDESYGRLSRDNSLCMVASVDGAAPRPLLGPEKAAIRQIAHEVLKSHKAGYGKTIAYDGMVVALPVMRITPKE